MKTWIAGAIAGVVIATPQLWAQGVAVKSPLCSKKIRVNSVKGGSGFFFDENCETGFVLPPRQGHLFLDGITETFDLGEQCLQVQYIQDTMTSLTREMANLLKKAKTDRQGGRGPISGREGRNRSDHTPPTATQLAAIRELQQLFIETRQLIEPYSKTYGATAKLIYDLPWSELVNEYQHKNPGFRFSRLPLEKAYLSFTRVENPDFAMMPALLSADIPGLAALPLDEEYFKIPQGDRISLHLEDTHEGSVLFSDAAGGQIKLSVLGACPFYQNGRGFPKSLSGKDLSAHLVANLQYSYSLQAYRKYKAEFHLGNMMKRVQTSTKQSGFFSSKTINSLIEEVDSEDWFKLDARSDDPRFSHEQLRQEIKADLMDRTLKQIAFAKFGTPAEAPALTQPEVHGASVAAGELQKCPHLYCQAGAALLNVLDATFGSTSAVSNFIRRNDFWATDDVEERRMFSYYGSSTFGG